MLVCHCSLEEWVRPHSFGDGESRQLPAFTESGKRGGSEPAGCCLRGAASGSRAGRAKRGVCLSQHLISSCLSEAVSEARKVKELPEVAQRQVYRPGPLTLRQVPPGQRPSTHGRVGDFLTPQALILSDISAPTVKGQMLCCPPLGGVPPFLSR